MVAGARTLFPQMWSEAVKHKNGVILGEVEGPTRSAFPGPCVETRGTFEEHQGPLKMVWRKLGEIFPDQTPTTMKCSSQPGGSSESRLQRERGCGAQARGKGCLSEEGRDGVRVGTGADVEGG